VFFSIPGDPRTVLKPSPSPTLTAVSPTPSASPVGAITPTPSPDLSGAVPSLTPTRQPVTPFPVVVVDTVRDLWDWVTVAGAITSVVVGAIAVFLAYKAYDAADKANIEASKAREAVAFERKRTFDLEILRDLLEVLDRVDMTREISRHPEYFEAHVGARLSLLPRDELKTWHAARVVRARD
jgi:hypothetical protein